jgi:outer membrane protein TolC
VELRQLAARASAAGARREAVRTERFPQLYLAGGYDFTENRYQVHEGNWSLAAGVEMNLFAGGATRERLLQKDRELLVLERQRELLLDAVRLEVREASLALGTARARVDVAGAAVGQARENLRLQRLRYDEGVGTATEVLDAVSLLGTAEQNELNAKCDVNDALARLDYAVGRDLAAAWGGPGATASGGQP